MNTTPSRFVIPEQVASHFHIRPGDVIADLGAGSGYFVPELAKRTGPSGKVLACEIQKPLVEKIGEVSASQNLHHVHPLWCDLEEAEGLKIESAAVDIAILINTLFAIEDRITAVQEIGRVLRPGGKLFIIDWTESFGGLGPTPEMVVNKDEAIALLESNGFVFETEYPAGDHHYRFYLLYLPPGPGQQQPGAFLW